MVIGAALGAWIGLNYLLGAWLFYRRGAESEGRSRLLAALSWPAMLLPRSRS